MTFRIEATSGCFVLIFFFFLKLSYFFWNEHSHWTLYWEYPMLPFCISSFFITTVCLDIHLE